MRGEVRHRRHRGVDAARRRRRARQPADPAHDNQIGHAARVGDRRADHLGFGAPRDVALAVALDESARLRVVLRDEVVPGLLVRDDDRDVLADLRDAVGADGVSEIGEDVSVVIPYEESRDYFVSQYDAKTGALIQRHRQRHVTRRAKAEVVGAAIADSGGVPDLIVVRRISGLPRAAAAAGGIDAAMAAVPYFTAHAYSLDDMRPTAPRCDMPNPFAPPKGRGGDAKQGAGSAKAKTPEDLERGGVYNDIAIPLFSSPMEQAVCVALAYRQLDIRS